MWILSDVNVSIQRALVEDENIFQSKVWRHWWLVTWIKVYYLHLEANSFALHQKFIITWFEATLLNLISQFWRFSVSNTIYNHVTCPTASISHSHRLSFLRWRERGVAQDDERNWSDSVVRMKYVNIKRDYLSLRIAHCAGVETKLLAARLLLIATGRGNWFGVTASREFHELTWPLSKFIK